MNDTTTHGANPQSGTPARPLAGKVALVTGAGSGIGRAAALAYARQGASLVLAGRHPAPLEEVAALAEREGARTAVVATDVSEEAQVAALVEGAVARFGRLDVAFNNAGMASFAPIEQLGVDEFDRVMATNVRGVWLLLKHEIAAMRRSGRGGAIVNTSSVAATIGTPGLSAYAASKAALDAMARVLALEAGPDGIRINNVSPGMTRTAMTAALAPEYLEGLARHTALGRIAEPQDIGDVVAWLSGDGARHVTGQSIVADGGFHRAGTP